MGVVQEAPLSLDVASPRPRIFDFHHPPHEGERKAQAMTMNRFSGDDA